MTNAAVSRRAEAGFLSSARSFFLPLGTQIDPEAVRGYPIDMRVKARSAVWPQAGVLAPGALHVMTAQYGLGCFERWLAGNGEQWLEAALATGRHLVSIQESDGSWLQTKAFPHTFPLPAPWASAITQGEGASLLVRLHLQTGEPELAAAARLALLPLWIPQAEGGLCGELGGMPWPEEYPTTPQSHVLNGGIFALWGMRDVAVGLGDRDAGRRFEDGVDALAANLGRYDAGYWSYYSLFPHPIRNPASSFYHALHISQLEAMELLAPRPVFAKTRTRWDGYARSPISSARAFVAKATFRLLVPRTRYSAARLLGYRR
jgi:heparosan-N-sulfate-glucuronate 5-epimerase